MFIVQLANILNYITWDVSPFIYEGEHFAIGWYGTLATISSIALLVIMLVIAKFDKVSIQTPLIMFMVISICTYLFGHIFHCLFYDWYYREEVINILGYKLHWYNPNLEHPMSLISFRHGGFASHGCIFGGIMAALLLKKMLNCSFFWVFDRIMLGSCSMMFVRIGNLINGEIYGVPTNLPWGVIFEQGALPAHPTQLYEIAYFIVAFLVGMYLFVQIENKNKYCGLISGLILLLLFVPRFFIEFIKLPQSQFETNLLLNMGQLLSLPYILWGMVILYWVYKGGYIEYSPPIFKRNIK